MHKGIAIFLCSTLVACAAQVPVAQGQQHDVLLTIDPLKNAPTVVTETDPNKWIVFKSVDFLSAAADPDPFTLVFQNSFLNEFEPQGNGAGQNPNVSPHQMRGTDVIFESSDTINGQKCTYDPPGPGAARDCQWVKIKLKNPPVQNTAGFIYQVEMGAWGQVIDPRLRGQ